MRKREKVMILVLAAVVFLAWITFTGKELRSLGHNGPLKKSETILATHETLLNTGEQVRSSPKSAKQSPLSKDDVEKLRSEARISLSAAYAAEMAFRMETGRFTTDLKATGFAPDKALLNLKFGFLEATPASSFLGKDRFQANEDPRRKDSDSFIGEPSSDPTEKYHYSAQADRIDIAKYADSCQRGCTADEKGFELLVIAPLDDDHIDIWRINHKKELKLVKDGLGP